MSASTCLRVGNCIPHLQRLSLYVPRVIPPHLCRRWVQQSELRGYSDTRTLAQPGSQVLQPVTAKYLLNPPLCDHVENAIQSSALAQHLLFMCWNHVPKHLSLQVEPTDVVHEPKPTNAGTWQLHGIHPCMHFTKYLDVQSHHVVPHTKSFMTCVSTGDHQHHVRCFLKLQIYLNDDYAEGATSLAKHTMQPQHISTGDVVFFDPQITHRAPPVILGTKYLLHSYVMYRRSRDDVQS